MDYWSNGVMDYSINEFQMANTSFQTEAHYFDA